MDGPPGVACMDTRHPRRLLAPEQVLMRFSIIYDRPSLSLPRMLVGTWSQRRPYEESDRIGDRITGRRRGVAAEVALPILQRRDGRGDRGGDGCGRRHAARK